MLYNSKDIEQKKYNIVFCSDDWFAMQLCVAIYSTIKNFNKKEYLNIFVLDSWISNENKLKINNSCKTFWVNIYFIDINCSLFSKHKVKWYKHYIFARLFVADIFTNLDKILYLDCDIVVDWDLSNLMETDVNNNSAWAVPYEFLVSDEELNTTLKHIWVWNPLFCSWVMLINLNRWRKHKVLEEAFKYYDKYQVPDEDILNNLLHDSVLHMPARYNVTNNLLYTHFYQETCLTKHEYIATIKSPTIIHFAWWSKPWHWDCFHKWNKIWRKYKKETQYTNRKLPSKYYFKLNRYKLMFGYILSNILSLFWFNFYNNCKNFWRKHIV